MATDWRFTNEINSSDRKKAFCIQYINETEYGLCLKDYIEKRVLENAGYIVEHRSTVRDCAQHRGTSKSTVHKDVSERIWEVDRRLAAAVRKVLDKNKEERHIRGGMATKKKKSLATK
jgi:putative DeoR family transcriptional regulator (stage III sporulation protein D)